MPGDNATPVVLDMHIALDNVQALAASKKFSSRISKDMGIIRKTSGQLDKQLQNMHKKLVPATKRWEMATVRVKKAEEKLSKTHTGMASHMLKLQAQLRDATDEETAAIQKQIGVFEKKIGVIVRAQKAGLEAAKATEKKEANAKEGDEAYEKFTGYTKSKAGEDMFDGFKDGIEGLRAKDFGGMIKGLAGGIGAGLKGAGAGITRGVEKGAAGGGPMAGIFKTIAPMMKSIGPILNTLGKMGPLLGAVASSVVSVVKMFIDAEAAAKDMNKEILASAGSGEFLGRNMGNAKAAAQDLGNTLGQIRDAATSLDNLKWGMTKETHTAVIGALTAEGVSLGKIEQEFKAVAGAAKEASGYAKDWGSMVQMSVAYGRSFGVSLNEITSLQGEMMSEIGMGLNSVQASFQYMAQGAEQSGIASNKFFGIIRGISSDMSLFNNRMQDSVKLLTQVGKVMSPRNAQKFMQTIMGFTKGMGLMDRTKSVLLGGGAKKVGGKLQEDLNRKVGGLAGDLGGVMGDELKDIFKNPKLNPGLRQKKLTEFMAKHQDKLSGAQNEAILDAARQQGKLSKGGLVDVASALKDASPFAVMDHLDDIGQTLFRKPIDQLTDVERLAAEQAAGISEELQDQMAKQKQGVLQMSQNLAQKLDSGAALTQEEQKLLERLNLTGTDQEKAAYIRGKDDKEAALRARDVWDAMSADQKKDLENSTKTIDYQKDIAGYQSSALDKLGVIMDWLLNQMYNAFMGIWEIVEDIWDTLTVGNSDARDTAKGQMQVAKTGNKELMEAASKGKTGDQVKKALMETSPAKEIARVMGEEGKKEREDLKKAKAELETKKAAAKTPEAAASFDKQIEAAQRDIDAAEARFKSAHDAQSKIIGAAGSTTTTSEALADFAKKYDTKGAADKKAAEAKKAAEDAKNAPPPGFIGPPDPNKGPKGFIGPPSPVAGSGAKPASAQAHAAQKAAAPGTAAAAAPKAGGAAPVAAAPAAAPPPNLAMAGATAVKNSSAAVGLNEEQLAAATESGNTLGDIYKALRVKGVRMDWKFHKDDAESIIEKGVLEGSRQSLLEYFVYSADKEGTMKALKEGKGAKDIGADALKAAGPKQPGNAAGGVPMRPATGEVFASIKPLSEAIIPLDKLGGGGGGAVIELRTTGDLTRFIDARVIDGNVKFNKNAKTR